VGLQFGEGSESGPVVWSTSLPPTISHPLPATRHLAHATRHPPNTARHMPQSSRLLVPGVCNSAGLLIEHAETYSGGVEFPMEIFWPMKSSEFVEALANRRLLVCGSFG